MKDHVALPVGRACSKLVQTMEFADRINIDADSDIATCNRLVQT
jgi:hypothetical protein